MPIPMKKLHTSLLLAFLLGFSGLAALAQTAGTPLTTQLIITRVLTAGLDTPTPTVAIDGLNFNATTSRVYLGTAAGLYQELTVQSRTATKIVAVLNTTAPGGYVLKVSTGTAAAQNFSVDLTLGATGATGAAGADGTGFLFRDAFQTGTAYLTNDVVTYLGSTYVATQDFVSAVNPDADAAHWALFVPQGAGGARRCYGRHGCDRSGWSDRRYGFRRPRRFDRPARDPGFDRCPRPGWFDRSCRCDGARRSGWPGRSRWPDRCHGSDWPNGRHRCPRPAGRSGCPGRDRCDRCPGSAGHPRTQFPDGQYRPAGIHLPQRRQYLQGRHALHP